MKIFKILAVALVAMLGFTACDKECGHDFIEYDHSKDLVGTWTCLTADYAEALIINADGSAVSYGVENGEYWEGVKGNIKTVNNKMTMTFEDDDNWEGRFEMVAGVAFTIYEENGESFTFRYCANDLAEEIVGMWVCTQSTAFDQEMSVNTYQEDGKALFTGYTPDVNGYKANLESTYKVIGDLLIQRYYVNEDAQYITLRLNYSPNATGMGDILTITSITNQEDQAVEQYASLLRIKQYLDLASKKYDYIKTFVTNVDGLDQDIDFMGYTFNFAKMDGTKIDKMLKALLFSVEFPSANKIKYSCRFSSGVQTVEAPIAVDGNKMTLKMSELYPTAKDVDLYTFQDADCSQMHMYMPTYAFINFFGNMQVIMMSQLGQLDTNNAEAVKAVFDSIDNAVNTINVSFVMTSSK